MVNQILKRITEGAPEERAQAALELAELATNDENLQHFTPEIMNSICSLLVLPIDNVTLVATQVVWTMTTFKEIASSMLHFNVVPKLLRIFNSMGMQPLSKAILATVQLNIVGALSRLISTMKDEHTNIYMPDVASVMSLASARNIDEVILP